MDILIGTKNKFKIGEMEWIIGGNPEITLHYIEELPHVIKIEEDQPTLLLNAEKKGRELSTLTDWYVFTSDGGVDIPALGDKWDILRNQRIVGEDRTDKEKVEILLNLMKDLQGEQRACSYYLAVALSKNGRIKWSKEALCESGMIAKRAVNEDIPPYRWMGSIWFYPQFGKTELELTEEDLEQVRQTRIPLKEGIQEAFASLNKIS